MIIMYIDIILLVILLFLSLFTCFYCMYRVSRLRQSGQLQILLRPTKVVFTHKNEIDHSDELRTVVAYKNPFTGDYCVHKTRVQGSGYMNEMEQCETESADSGMSDAYEPLRLEPHQKLEDHPIPELKTNLDVNSVNKTWNWNYKEYQI